MTRSFSPAPVLGPWTDVKATYPDGATTHTNTTGADIHFLLFGATGGTSLVLDGIALNGGLAVVGTNEGLFFTVRPLGTFRFATAGGVGTLYARRF